MITGSGRISARTRHVADADAAVDARLVDPDRDAGLGEGRAGDAGDERESENLLHESVSSTVCHMINASPNDGAGGLQGAGCVSDFTP